MTHDPDQASTGDSAMDTGSEAGAPGEHLAELALTPDELALLAQLQQPADDVVVPVEESPAVAAAADDDSPLPVADPPHERSDDPLDVHFTNPADDVHPE